MPHFSDQLICLCRKTHGQLNLRPLSVVQLGWLHFATTILGFCNALPVFSYLIQPKIFFVA